MNLAFKETLSLLEELNISTEAELKELLRACEKIEEITGADITGDI